MHRTGNVLPITAVIVHFRTFDLTRMAIQSLKSMYESLPVIVIENNSNDGSREQLIALQSGIPGLTLCEMSEHLHHGPGLHYAIERCTSEWILLCDSDIIVYRSGAIEAMLELAEPKTYMIGEAQPVDRDGFPHQGPEPPAIRYIHPFFTLVRRRMYLELPSFEKHGAPCLRNELAALERSYRLQHFPVREYVYHFGRGTVEGEGYGLGLQGQFSKVRRYYRRLRGIFRK